MEKQTHYYLIGNEIKKGEAKPYQANVMRTNPVFAEAEDILYKEWFNSLQPCSVTDVELEKVINGICKLYAIEGIDVSQPIEVTELITDNDGVVTFRDKENSDTLLINAATLAKVKYDADVMNWLSSTNDGSNNFFIEQLIDFAKSDAVKHYHTPKSEDNEALQKSHDELLKIAKHYIKNHDYYVIANADKLTRNNE